MHDVWCPKCKSVLKEPHVDVTRNAAICVNCNVVFSVSAIGEAGVESEEDFDIHSPPSGAAFQGTAAAWRITTSTRTPAAFVSVPFACLWVGFVLFGLYGQTIIHGTFSLILSLIGIPFLIASAVLVSVALMNVCGRVVVSVDGADGQVFTGVGSIGWTRRFDWRAITAINEFFYVPNQRGVSRVAVSLVGTERLQFGMMLNEPRRHYLIQTLRTLLALRRIANRPQAN